MDRDEPLRIFTEHVRSLEPGKNPPGPERVAAVRKALRVALKSELKRRGLWESPPRYLGIYGWERWEEGAPSGDDALSELCAEAYVFIFATRLRSLRTHLESKENVDGLIFLNLRHFLHERQKEHDPVGSQVFEVLQSAVRRSLSSGELHVLRGEASVRNDTVLGFTPEADPGSAVPADLRSLAVRWNSDLLPDLLTARGKRQEEVVQKLRERLPELRQEGVEAFRFKDLIDPMKADVRARWAALHERGDGDVAVEAAGDESTLTRLVQPDTDVEDRQFFKKVVSCVLESLERLEARDKTRAYLQNLWSFVRLEARDSGQEVSGRPSARKVSDLLGIPRDRLPQLYDTLGRIVSRCRDANSGKLAVT